MLYFIFLWQNTKGTTFAYFWYCIYMYSKIFQPSKCNCFTLFKLSHLKICKIINKSYLFFSGCRKKKIHETDGKCLKSALTLCMKVNINDEEKDHTITIFEEDTCTLFGPLEFTSQQDVILACAEKLPIKCKGKIHNTN